MWELKNNLFIENSFPFKHFTTTRSLGNMRDENVRNNFFISKGIDPKKVITLEQTHSKLVVVAKWEDRGTQIKEADGIVSNISGLGLAMFTADCLPVFLCDPKKRIIAAVHAGWQGVAKKIVTEAVNVLKKTNKVRASDLVVAIGPHIQKDCFAIEDDLREIFDVDKKVKNLDLAEIAVKQLEECGVKNVSVSSSCTCHEENIFYSFRRDKGKERMMSFIMLE